MKTTQRTAAFGRHLWRTAWLCGALCLATAGRAATPLLDFGFDEGSGTTVTDKVNSLVGTLGSPLDPANDPVLVPGPSGAAGDQAISLNVGSDIGQGFLVVDDSTNSVMAFATNAFTMEAWINIDPADLRQYEGIGAYGSSYKLGLNAGQLIFTLFGIVDIESGFAVPYGEWHHVAAVWEPGKGVTFYLDGAPNFVEETRLPRAFGNRYLTIGAEGVGGNALQGSIDRFRVHNTALTVDDLDSVAATPKAPLASTVVSYAFSGSAPPFPSAAPASRPAFTSNTYLASTTRPVFTTDTPSGKTNDFALKIANGQKVIIPDPNQAFNLDPSNPSFTVQAWVKFGAQPGGRSVFFYNNGPGGAISMSVTSDRRVFVTTLGILDATSDAFIPDDGGWHHIAVVHENGKEIRYYVDGILGYTRAYTSGVIFARTETQLYLGSEPSGSLQYVGSLDRVKASAEALPVDQLDYFLVPGVTPTAPSVGIETAIQVTWPTVPAGYQLQRSTDLGDVKNWSTITNKPSVGPGVYYYLFPSTSGKVFYRLIKP
ncbi:MAG TPA: LamG domain-containing protein [Verrucomicrobiae bacterium]|nr:LamG domain-containing protein [Verrucomicrobiae bacterium]